MKSFGVRYLNGKVMFFIADTEGKFPNNPGVATPDWSVDIREVLAMFFVGSAAICLILKGDINEAMYLLVGLLGYATGRTIPSPTKRRLEKKQSN